MIKKAQRYFNTSGPNRLDKHYTIKREGLITKGINLIKDERYFTIWAPRQTGKSTYFRLLAKQLKKIGYKVLHTNVENFKNTTEQRLLTVLSNEAKRNIGIEFKSRTFDAWLDELKSINDFKAVFIIDEIEGVNSEIFGQFLHTIRNLYHFREDHFIKSFVLVGVSNIIGVVQDNASPFNIADNLDVPYFTNEETLELLHMHEKETGQFFDENVKAKISEITANQPGLVNGFAYQLVTRWPAKEVLDYKDYLQVESWYLKEAIDKNIANVINKAEQYRSFVEGLLFKENKVEYDIERPAIKFLHTQGILERGEDGFVKFWVPIYKKKLFSAFYPYLNGESDELRQEINLGGFFIEDGQLNFDKLVEGYKTYVKRRGFRYFREKDKDGNWKHIKEAAMVYSFESFIQLLLQEVDGKSYLEAHTGLGNSDLIINIDGNETVIEFKIYRSSKQFNDGIKQIAHYAESISVKEAIYLLFVKDVYKQLGLKDDVVRSGDVTVRNYIVYFNEEKDF